MLALEGDWLDTPLLDLDLFASACGTNTRSIAPLYQILRDLHAKREFVSVSLVQPYFPLRGEKAEESLLFLEGVYYSRKESRTMIHLLVPTLVCTELTQ